MSMEWVLVGDSLLNVNAIEFVERVSRKPMIIIIHLASGKKVELTETVAVGLWKFLDSERLQFLDLDNPERDFSGT